MTIEEKLNSIRQTKEAIKTSIRNKGVELEDTAPFNTYSSKIDEITTKVETENIEITPTKETQTINRSEDKYIESVKVNAIPDEYIIPSGELEITENGQYNVANKASVNVEIASSGSGDISEYFNDTITYGDSSYNGLTKSIKKVPAFTFNSTSAKNMFYGCFALEEIDLSNFDMSKVTDMSLMFGNCQKLSSLDVSNFDTGKVTNMQSVFTNCGKLTNLDVSDWNTVKVTNMNQIFDRCSSLTSLDVSKWNTSAVTTMSSTFSQCEALAKLDLSSWDVSKVTSMNGMFGACPFTTIGQGSEYDLNLTNWNLLKVTNMQNTFQNCDKLVTFDVRNLPCSTLTSIYSMFSMCDAIETINIASFDLGKVTNVSLFLNSVTTLINLTFGINLGKGYTSSTTNYSSYKLDLSKCTLLTHDSLIDVINKLYDLNLTYNVANGGTLRTQGLVLGATNIAKLTEEELNIAIQKGWTVS